MPIHLQQACDPWLYGKRSAPEPCIRTIKRLMMITFTRESDDFSVVTDPLMSLFSLRFIVSVLKHKTFIRKSPSIKNDKTRGKCLNMEYVAIATHLSLINTNCSVVAMSQRARRHRDRGVRVRVLPTRRHDYTADGINATA